MEPIRTLDERAAPPESVVLPAGRRFAYDGGMGDTMERERKVERAGDDTTERPAADAAGSVPSAHVQFKGGGDIPAVGGSFRARTSDTDAAYETTPAGDAPVQLLAAPEQPGESVQFIRGAVGGSSKPGKLRTNPTSGVTEVWSPSENKWIVHVNDDPNGGSGGGTGGGGGG